MYYNVFRISQQAHDNRRYANLIAQHRKLYIEQHIERHTRTLCTQTRMRMGIFNKKLGARVCVFFTPFTLDRTKENWSLCPDISSKRIAFTILCVCVFAHCHDIQQNNGKRKKRPLFPISIHAVQICIWLHIIMFALAAFYVNLIRPLLDFNK